MIVVVIVVVVVIVIVIVVVVVAARLRLLDQLTQRRILGPLGVQVVEEPELAVERRELLEQRVGVAVAVEIEEERAVLALPRHERPAQRRARRFEPLLLERAAPAI